MEAHGQLSSLPTRKCGHMFTTTVELLNVYRFRLHLGKQSKAGDQVRRLIQDCCGSVTGLWCCMTITWRQRRRRSGSEQAKGITTRRHYES